MWGPLHIWGRVDFTQDFSYAIRNIYCEKGRHHHRSLCSSPGGTHHHPHWLPGKISPDLWKGLSLNPGQSFHRRALGDTSPPRFMFRGTKAQKQEVSEPEPGMTPPTHHSLWKKGPDTTDICGPCLRGPSPQLPTDSPEWSYLVTDSWRGLGRVSLLTLQEAQPPLPSSTGTVGQVQGAPDAGRTASAVPIVTTHPLSGLWCSSVFSSHLQRDWLRPWLTTFNKENLKK